MPILAAWLGGLFLGLVEFFAAYVAKRVAIALAVTALVVAAWATLFAAVSAVVSGVSQAIPTNIATGMQLVEPTGFDGLVAAWISIELALATYRWFKKVQKFSFHSANEE